MAWVRVYGLENRYLQQFDHRREQLNARSVRRACSQSAVTELAGLTQSMATFVSAYFLAGGAANAPIAVGKIMTFLFLMDQVQLPFINMSSTWATLQQAIGSGQRVANFVDSLAQGDSNPTGSKKSLATVRALSSTTACSIAPPNADRPMQLAIRLRAVTWSPIADRTTRDMDPSRAYRTSPPLLDGINLDVELSQILAVMGPSGVGKTSLARILAGLYRPDAGQIDVFGQDLSDLHSPVRNQIAYLPQAPYVFSGTVRDNLVMANPKASETAIADAVRLAACDEFIQSLPLGYDTPVGEGGVALSGGQRQRLAIARVILSERPILILDEPSAALDATSEEHLAKSLTNLRNRCALVVISHHSALIERADRVMQLQNVHLTEV